MPKLRWLGQLTRLPVVENPTKTAIEYQTSTILIEYRVLNTKKTVLTTELKIPS